MNRLSNEQYSKFVKNMITFTAPALAVFFAQLAMGVDAKAASTVAMLALYGIIADYLKKM